MKKIPLREKVKLTSGQSNWHFFDSEHVLGRSMHVADGPHGIRVYKKQTDGGNFLDKEHLEPATLFPCAAAMAATWNKTLIETVGRTIGKECRHHQVDVVLGPGINLKRSPLGGRNFEYYSEDPYLTGAIGQAFVRGVQKEGVGACIKHYALNEQETMRRFVDVTIDERTMHEMYLYPFYHIIKKENPWMVMSSYNKVNGDYASESRYLLQDVLRKQWGYDGVVVSDWGAVQDKVKAIKNGMNIEMPGPSALDDAVKTALEEGTLREAQLDASLKPLFALHEKVKRVHRLQTVDMDAHHTAARDVAREAIVLLENDGILPVKDTAQKVGIIGAFAKEPRINGGGSATVRPYVQEVPYLALSQVFSQNMYAAGYHESDTSETLMREAIEVARASDLVFFFTGTTAAIETEGKDREHINLPQGHLAVFQAICDVNPNIIVILNNGSALDLRTIKARSRAVLEAWFLGGAAGEALSEIITGKTSPSGRLQETFPLDLRHTPHYGTFPPLMHVDYQQDLIMNGYRYYDTHDYPVLYPFGYGLSYADIAYKDIVFTVDQTDEQAVVKVDFILKNHSDIDAYETVQLYIGTHIETLLKPVRELKGFEKVMVLAQETVTVRLTLPLEAFETYDTTQHGFVVYNGTYTLHLARHSRDIVAMKTIEITDQIHYAPRITFDYPMQFLKRYFPKWFTYIETHFRPLHWHETEEPIWRMLDRYQRHKQIPDDVMDALKQNMKRDFES